MVTMFSVVGDHLVATHYCSAGNQPQMVTEPIADPQKNVLAFSLVAHITGMTTPDELAQHRVGSAFWRIKTICLQNWELGSTRAKRRVSFHPEKRTKRNEQR